MVEAGQYKMGLYLPPKATTTLRRTISAEIKKQMNQGSAASKKTEIAPSEIEIFYDPVIKASFKQAVSGSIQQIIAHIQTQMVFKSYTKTIENITGKSNNDLYPIDKIQVKETATGHFANSPLPNSRASITYPLGPFSPSFLSLSHYRDRLLPSEQKAPWVGCAPFPPPFIFIS